MSPEDQELFDSYRELFMSEGWKEFLTLIEALAEQCDIRYAHDANEFWKSKGRLEALDWVIGFEDSIKAAETMEEEDAGDYGRALH